MNQRRETETGRNVTVTEKLLCLPDKQSHTHPDGTGECSLLGLFSDLLYQLHCSLVE